MTSSEREILTELLGIVAREHEGRCIPPPDFRRPYCRTCYTPKQEAVTPPPIPDLHIEEMEFTTSQRYKLLQTVTVSVPGYEPGLELQTCEMEVIEINIDRHGMSKVKLRRKKTPFTKEER